MNNARDELLPTTQPSASHHSFSPESLTIGRRPRRRHVERNRDYGVHKRHRKSGRLATLAAKWRPVVAVLLLLLAIIIAGNAMLMLIRRVMKTESDAVQNVVAAKEANPAPEKERRPWIPPAVVDELIPDIEPVLQPQHRLEDAVAIDDISVDAEKQQQKQDRTQDARVSAPAVNVKGATRVPPISIQLSNSHFFGPGYARRVPDCKLPETGALLDCTVLSMGQRHAGPVDAQMWHLPTVSVSKIERQFPQQLLVAYSMESAEYYANMNNENFMSQFDITMTYRLDSDVPMLYSNEWVNPGLFKPALPLDKKTPAVVFLNSNCGALNGRTEIVKRVMDLGEIEVHSYGRCLHNRQMAPDNDKVALFSRYKFCIAMENSNSKDYVTEKLWQALMSGCLPIYYGAPNIADFLPAAVADMIIDYNAFRTPEKLSAYLAHLNADDAAYEAKFNWKKLKLEETLAGYRNLVKVADAGHSQCVLCQTVARRRIIP